ncbi:hypothetical protein [Burkholderia cenocepacia]|nr:hypothetical protein [Burkholderia cenocepacia]MCW3644449.1 hypothetical protein [Burkholderia cenocepacia]
MLITLFQRIELSRSKSRVARARDWHPLVALVVLYLIASAIAPSCGI